MLFNSVMFLLFFPLVLCIYFVIPNRAKCFWLLISSYYFYMCWNAKYIFLILFSTVITYLSGILIEKIKWADYNLSRKNILKKLVVLGSIIFNLGILFYFKYINFIISVLNGVFAKVHIQMNLPIVDIILPIGISFYTFQAISYTLDVYRDDIYAETNFFKYALFIAFFPQLVAGPIERTRNLLKQLAVPKEFNYERARDGFWLMLWGFFQKIVLADRIAIFVDTVYGNYDLFEGYYLVVASMLFAVQIYCDFSGYSTIAIGSAEILGIDLMQNFDAPYLSLSVAEFWRRWHISLTSWFRDYLYIPLGGNKKGKFRKYVNELIVFLSSGLWHGANLSFIVWGGVNGIYQVVGELSSPIKNRCIESLRINKASFGYKMFHILCTFTLIDFSWIFFRASTCNEAIHIIKSILSAKNLWILFDGSLFSCGLDRKNYWLMLVCIGILIFADCCKHKGVEIRKKVCRQSYLFRCVFTAFCVTFILIFGIWGAAYDATSFIYFQF